jgi:NAD+ synthase (glutamine-hydrolysing)
MTWLKLGAAALNQLPLDWEGNRSRICAAVDAARRVGVGLLLMPELCVTGYGCEDAFFGLGVTEAAARMVEDLREMANGIAIVVGLPVRYESALYSAACVLHDQKILGATAKQTLAGDGIHYEPRWFKPWLPGMQTEVVLGGHTVPFGDLVFQLGDVRIGFEICEDAWIARRRSIALADRNVDVILNPSASHFAFGKHAVRERIVLEASRAQHVAYVYANLLGNEAGRILYDGGGLIAADGRLLGRAKRFEFAPWHLLTASVDIEDARRKRGQDHNFLPPITAIVGLVTSSTRLPEAPLEDRLTLDEQAKRLDAIPHAMSKEEEFTRAVALGLFDYARKSGSCGFVVSLSGGADSAAVSVLVAESWRLAEMTYGREALKRMFRIGSDEDPMRSFLLCAYQATQNSSDATYQAAKQVAESVGATFVRWDVQSLVDGYTERVETALGRSLSWDFDDAALQNIQARVRAPGIWMLANIRGALLLSTSNRSEAAVGYATMDGDTCGGVSPIAGIDKAFLRQWLVWMEETGLAELGPLPALSIVNQLEPTAELRPPGAHQTDEEDLMPYAVLDRIERLAIRDKRTPEQCLEILGNEFPGETGEHLLDWVRRFFRLWSRNQWKRERYAPSFHLDDENLDPKTWCRFPILSAGFAEELQRLDEKATYVAKE